MDLGSMTKKLKSLSYKSKAEFVQDLNLIWDNCLLYNTDMSHPFRRLANGMRKEAEKLIPLIPDLVVRPRAEVEAEERRKQNGGEDDAGDDSDDEPIMSSRGRTAGTKGASKSRKAPSDQKEDTPNQDPKPLIQVNGLLAKAHREGSEMDGSNGFATPPVGVAGTSTPGAFSNTAVGNAPDAMDIDGPTLNGLALGHALREAAEQAYEDDEYKIWKQVTKKDRARVATQRFQLFKDGKLNIDEPALLRTKASMRRFAKSRQEAHADPAADEQAAADVTASVGNAGKSRETLAENMEGADEGTANLPDYYEPLAVIPDVPAKSRWVEDGSGEVINHHGEYLTVVPSGYFTTPPSALAKKMDGILRQIQDTRKVAARIGMVKQMQTQTQVGAPYCQLWLIGIEYQRNHHANTAIAVHEPIPQVQPRATLGARH